MTVTIFGGGGFLGMRLMEALRKAGEMRIAGETVPIERIVLVDTPSATVPTNIQNVSVHLGDISERSFVAAAIGPETRAVFHLAAVVSSAAEADFALGYRVNVEGTTNVLEAARSACAFLPVVSTSSLAVFGDGVHPPLDESSPVQPRSSYGTQKAIGELLGMDYRRRGLVDVRTVRLPTVVIRPGKPNAAASSFASSILREPLQGLEAILPVPRNLSLWIASPETVVSGLIHAIGVAEHTWPSVPAVNLPGLTVTVNEMLDTLRRLAGEEAVDLVREQPDPAIAAIVGTWPDNFDTSMARTLGFPRDDTFFEIATRFKTGLAAT